MNIHTRTYNTHRNFNEIVKERKKRRAHWKIHGEQRAKRTHRIDEHNNNKKNKTREGKKNVSAKIVLTVVGNVFVRWVKWGLSMFGKIVLQQYLTTCNRIRFSYIRYSIAPTTKSVLAEQSQRMWHRCLAPHIFQSLISPHLTVPSTESTHNVSQVGTEYGVNVMPCHAKCQTIFISFRRSIAIRNANREIIKNKDESILCAETTKGVESMEFYTL